MEVGVVSSLCTITENKQYLIVRKWKTVASVLDPDLHFKNMDTDPELKTC